MAYNKTIWVNNQTELSAENMNHIENGIEDAYNVSLLAVSDTAPSQCEEGDKYYNTEDKVIYTATGTDTWGETGEEPLQDILYVVFEEKNTYAWDGIDMLSVGGGSGSQVVVEPDEPTEDTKLLIEESDLDFQGLEISNEYTTGDNVAYSADYVNGCNAYSTDEIFTGKYWIDGKKIYRKIIHIDSLNYNTTRYINHNISNFEYCTDISWVLKFGSSFASSNYFTNFSEGYYLKIAATNTQIVVNTNVAWGTNSEAYVTLEYTKTS